ncbi:MAG TPA: MBL fold metallo-hydrolase [Nitrospirae bacterium]|nr:MBL fold metallo-hydrolase [Nitrospirota bacterium]HDH50600.1 MBL fold metallo-hydrolase [Nitrospirota bacterium]
MTDSPEALILDVGHGNCTVILADGSVCVVDSPVGTTLLEALLQLGINRVDTIVLSHADKDHVAGVSILLTCHEIDVHTLYVNSDATKQGPRSPWHKLRVAIRVAREKGLTVVPTLTSDSSPIAVGTASLEVLAPTPELILGGAGSTGVGDKIILTSNSTSAVIRVVYKDKGMFLLPGDLDGTGLDSMIAEGKDATAKTLLFPHHGGLPGNAYVEDFAFTLCKHVQPELIVFSNSRGRFSHPRPEIVASIRKVSSAMIACTQLSRECLEVTDEVSDEHLHDLPSHGKKDKSCCAGSIRFCLDDLLTHDPIACLLLHKEFVSTYVRSSLCKS